MVVWLCRQFKSKSIYIREYREKRRKSPRDNKINFNRYKKKKKWFIFEDLRPIVPYNVYYMKEKIVILILHNDTNRKDINLDCKDLTTLVNTKRVFVHEKEHLMKKKIK